ncbi:MAG: HAD family hydrolase [Candidatus Competibacterales bacterium]
MAEMPYDALIFDFDGVIVDSVELKVAAFAELYNQRDPAIVDAVTAHQRRHGGQGRLEKFRHFEEVLRGRPPLTAAALQALADDYGRRVEDAVVACPGIPGAEDFLARWHQKIPLFIASGTLDTELQRIVQRRGLADYLVRAYGTPPEKHLRIEELLNTHPYRPQRVVMIGDAITDYDAAQFNGIGFVGVVAPGYPNPFPDDVRAMADLRSLESFLALG